MMKKKQEARKLGRAEERKKQKPIEFPFILGYIRVNRPS
jgi:hypothetical protein